LNLGDPEEKMEKRLQGFQALSRVLMPYRFIDVEEKGDSGSSQGFQQRRKAVNVLGGDSSPIKSQLTDSLGPQG
jgi:hypothetical protein